MKIIISGINGHMGRELAALALQHVRGAELIGGIDLMDTSEKDGVPVAGSFEDAPQGADVLIDFSHHSCTAALLKLAEERKLPLVLATTGQTDEERQAILDASKRIPLFFAANYSLGVALLMELAKMTARLMPDAEIEIVEKHHDRKLDAPSGTALALAEAIKEVRPAASFHCGRSGQGKRTKEEIGIHAIRMGNIVGEHEVLIGTPNQTISLKHEAHSRALFAEGALAAADFLKGKPAGIYTMENLVNA